MYYFVIGFSMSVLTVGEMYMYLYFAFPRCAIQNICFKLLLFLTFRSRSSGLRVNGEFNTIFHIIFPTSIHLKHATININLFTQTPFDVGVYFYHYPSRTRCVKIHSKFHTSHFSQIMSNQRFALKQKQSKIKTIETPLQIAKINIFVYNTLNSNTSLLYTLIIRYPYL